MTILRVNGLSKRYPAFCLRDVSFSIEEGRVMGLIGRNGAGKTTTIKSILRLVRPDGGTVQFLGKPLDMDASALRREAGYVSGDLCYYPRKRLSQLTAVTKSFYPSWDDKKYEALLHRFSLDETKRVCELSAGMKVKYQLACALSHGAKLLILDEPTSGLDPVSRDDLLDLLRTLCEQGGVSILFSTHITTDLRRVRRRCDVSAKRNRRGQLSARGIHRAVEKAHGAGSFAFAGAQKDAARPSRPSAANSRGSFQAHLPALRGAGKKRRICRA